MKTLQAGDRHYRAFVGPPEKYDILSAIQFNLLTLLGLRENHYLLDLGCGSLRAGRLFIPYLLPNRYFGIEPESWLIDEAIKNEIGKDIIKIKKAQFLNGTEFPVNKFGVKFDYVIAQSILSHSSPKQTAQCLKEVSKGLNISGIFAATFVLGDTDYKGTEWVYPGCIEYTEDGMKEFAFHAGLQMLMIDWAHPNGQTWALFYHKENQENIFDPTYPRNQQYIQKIDVEEFIDDHQWNVGYFDNCKRIGRRIIASGWAKHPHKIESAEQIILVTEDKKIVGFGKVNMKRSDVSAAYSNDNLENSGWELIFSDVENNTIKLNAYLYLKDVKRAILLQNSFTV